MTYLVPHGLEAWGPWGFNDSECDLLATGFKERNKDGNILLKLLGFSVTFKSFVYAK